MGVKKDRIRALCAIAAVALVVFAGCFWMANSRDAWFVKSLVDRVAPWESTAICYAQAPDAHDYFDAYDDAAGAYENYVYEVDAVDARGMHRRVVLVSFGTMLENEGCIEMTVNGTSAHTWEYIDDEKLPEAVRGRIVR
ncbi:MAG: hypothetical protein Q4B69_05230 [Slackia sp.]|nr:hypothetical protein [Slackia sp.]